MEFADAVDNVNGRLAPNRIWLLRSCYKVGESEEEATSFVYSEAGLITIPLTNKDTKGAQLALTNKPRFSLLYSFMRNLLASQRLQISLNNRSSEKKKMAKSY